MMQLKVRRLVSDAVLPAYAHGPLEDAGMDLCSVVDAVLEPGVPQAVATGLSIELPPGYEAQVRPRSGLAFKHGVTVLNTPGLQIITATDAANGISSTVPFMVTIDPATVPTLSLTHWLALIACCALVGGLSMHIRARRLSR